jgi:hypothetical protein
MGFNGVGGCVGENLVVTRPLVGREIKIKKVGLKHENFKSRNGGTNGKLKPMD